MHLKTKNAIYLYPFRHAGLVPASSKLMFFYWILVLTGMTAPLNLMF